VLLLLLFQVVASVDTAFLDACFYSASELPGRDIKQIPHPLIVDTAERLKDVPHKHVVLVHMNHSNPVYRAGLEQQACAAAGLEIGQQGTVYGL
jgi:pyrroloquinoline quinone biosynthesis protein B